jgi:glycogen synthase
MYNQVSFLGLFLAPDIWSLAFFFRSHATFETLRNLLAHGTRMSSSMYYKSLFSRGFFSLSDFWLFPFSFDPLPPWKR